MLYDFGTTISWSRETHATKIISTEAILYLKHNSIVNPITLFYSKIYFNKLLMLRYAYSGETHQTFCTSHSSTGIYKFTLSYQAI